MTWRNEDYDFVHESIIDEKRPAWENWKEALETTAQGYHQRMICKQKIEQLETFVNNLH